MAESHTIQEIIYISVIINFLFVKFSDGFITTQDKFYGEEGVLVCNHGNNSINVDSISESTVVDCGGGKQVNLFVHQSDNVFEIDLGDDANSKFSRKSAWSKCNGCKTRGEEWRYLYPGENIETQSEMSTEIHTHYPNTSVFFETETCIPDKFCRKSKNLPQFIEPILNKTTNHYILKCGENKRSLAPIRWELDGEIVLKSENEQGISLDQLSRLEISKPASRNYDAAICYLGGEVLAFYKLPKLGHVSGENDNATFLRDNWAYIQNGLLGQTIFYVMLWLVDKFKVSKSAGY